MANIQNQDVLGGPSSAPGSATSMEKKNRRRNNAARRRLNNYWQQLQQTQQVQQTQEEHPEEQEQRTEIPSEDLIFHIPEPILAGVLSVKQALPGSTLGLFGRIDRLPGEIINGIIENCEYQELVAIALTCKRLASFVVNLNILSLSGIAAEVKHAVRRHTDGFVVDRFNRKSLLACTRLPCLPIMEPTWAKHIKKQVMLKDKPKGKGAGGRAS